MRAIRALFAIDQIQDSVVSLHSSWQKVRIARPLATASRLGLRLGLPFELRSSAHHVGV